MFPATESYRYKLIKNNLLKIFQGAKRACVSLSKPKTILEKKAAATGTQKIFDPDLDIKEAQEIIKRQYKEKEVIKQAQANLNSFSGAKTTSRSRKN